MNTSPAFIRITRSYFNALLFLLFSLYIATSCSDDDVSPKKQDNLPKADPYVNAWILENMKDAYFWNDQLPTNPDTDQDPASFFSSLLHQDDRFSWIEDNYIELLNAMQGINKEAGFEYKLYRESMAGTGIVAQIMYVKPSSPAALAGLKRGDLISHINDTKITTINYETLIQELKDNHSLRYKPLVVGEDRFSNEKTVSLSTVEFSENPNFYYDVIYTNDKKIGYYVYNFFASGTTTNEKKYDNEMDAIFADFKSQGITDLILDLRFNSGGSEVSANNLASLIAPGINGSSVFFKRQYNEKITDEIMLEPSPDEYLVSRFQEKENNIGNQLFNSTVYVLTSSRTASASELIINGLRPYMNVIIVGEVTYGKNVGSVSLYEANDPKNKWGMQPIIVKAFNSLGQSDYSGGFNPDLENADNDLFIFPLGDLRESMLAQTLGHITGESSFGRERLDQYGARAPVAHSVDFKRRGFSLIIERPFRSY